jgi:hypothetical protein
MIGDTKPDREATPGARRAIRRLLRALDALLAAAREAQLARAALDRAASRTGRLRIVPQEEECDA